MQSGNALSRTRIIVLLVLSATSLACIVTGALPCIDVADRWLRDDFTFPGMEGFAWLGAVFGVALISIGLLIAGIALRLSRWKDAPQASFGLAIGSAAFLVIAFAILIQAESQRAHGGFELLSGITAGGLVFAVLPPLLHWWMARRRKSLSPIPGMR